MMPLITVGHGPQDRASLGARLTAAGIGQIVDVRRFPRSRNNPDVAREELGRDPVADLGQRPCVHRVRTACPSAGRSDRPVRAHDQPNLLPELPNGTRSIQFRRGAEPPPSELLTSSVGEGLSDDSGPFQSTIEPSE